MTDEQPPTGPESAPTVSGVGAFVARHRTALLVSAIAVGFVLLGTGSVFAGAAIPSPKRAAPVEHPTPTAMPPRPVPQTVAAAMPVRTCSIAQLAGDPRLMSFEGTVALTDGTVLFDRNGATPARTGSVMKVLTAAAALAKLGPDFRIATTVVDGAAPGQIVLVGRGDPTLSAGQGSVYAGAPQLSDLAKQAVAAYSAKHPDVPITQVVLDASYWDAKDKWDPSWKRSEQQIGYHSEVTALQVDGDRANPRAQTSPRSTDPIGRAGNAFLAALHAADPGGIVDGSASTVVGTAASGAVLGTVSSQPIKTLIPQMLLPSDNTLGEMLARIVSKASGSDGSAASLNTVIPAALEVYGVPMAGVTIRDGSGLSDLNAVPAATMAAFMTAVNAGKNNLGIIGGGLSVAGQTGSLASRFTGDNAVARGAVWGKTGWIDTEYSLAGYLKAADGTVMSYAFYAIGANIKDTAKQAIDSLATGAFRCGANLSNY